MKRNKRVEDYMKIIYRHREKDFARSVDIAHELGVSKPTVSVALREMEDSGLITVHLSRSVELTEKGKQIARYVMDRYNTVYNLLTGLGVDEKTAEKDACKMEHGISDSSLKALQELQGYLQNTHSVSQGQINQMEA